MDLSVETESRSRASSTSSTTPADPVEQLRRSLDEVGEQLRLLEDKYVSLKRLDAKVDKDSEACLAEVKSRQKHLNGLIRALLETGSEGAALRAQADDYLNRLAVIEDRYPRPSPFMLRLSLGSANVSMPVKERYKYKTEYENFKLQFTFVQLAFGILNYIYIDYVWLNSVFNFLVLYYYCTLALRENILVVNGSHIRKWWLAHHYLSAGLSAVLLMWPELSELKDLRTQIVIFYFYLGGVQFLQFRYQMNRLYTLRSLGKKGVMDVTTDTAPVGLRGLSLLLPFLLFGQLLQLYNGTTITWYSFTAPKGFDWHAFVVGLLFLITGMGNMYTTLVIFFKKMAKTRKEKAASLARQKEN